MTERKEFTYNARRADYELRDTLDLTSYRSVPIKNIAQDEMFDEIHIEFEPEIPHIVIFLLKDDSRDISDMDTNKCTRPAYGCCYDHCGCGDDRCSEHHPLQKLDIRYDPEAFKGKYIVGFEFVKPYDYSYAYHEFNFILSDGTKAPFNITNSTYEYGFTLTIRIDE